MFTGIIEGLGTIRAVSASGGGRRLTVEADFNLDRLKIGDSIAVSGACLTVVHLENNRFKVDVSPETLKKTTLGMASAGHRVNLERALRMGGRLDGHLVSGHIDHMATVTKKEEDRNAILLSFKIAPPLTKYMITKGSVAIDGVSLTINDCHAGSFNVSIIPHTAGTTTIGSVRIGNLVNIETDMIGKYVEQFVRFRNEGENHQSPNSSINMRFLSEKGFL